MAVDYIIDQPCKVKEALSLDGMITMIKQRDRALAVIEAMRKDGKTDEQIMNTTFRMNLATPDGIRVTEQRVADLLRGASRLDELQAHCKECAASGGQPFGCYRSVRYPISRKAEEWLAGVARKAAESRGPGMLPLQFIVEKKVGGDNMARMRADPKGLFFELKRPLDIPVTAGTGLFSRKTVNTDQVFNLVIGLNRMGGAHMKMLLLMSGGLSVTRDEPPAGSYQQGFRATGDDGSVSWWTYRLDSGPADDTSTLELKVYFRMMFLALALDRNLIVSI